MRNSPSDKYNVAWFKLAECVARGEKERALGMYRLLTHSLNDSSLARQLQGDIFLSFNDTPTAIEHYKAAAQLYKQSDRFLEAVAVYEHIATLVEDKQEPLIFLIDVYCMIGFYSRAITATARLLPLLLEKMELEKAREYLENLDKGLVTPHEEMTFMRKALIYAYARHEAHPPLNIHSHLKKLIVVLTTDTDSAHHHLSQFLLHLESLNKDYALLAETLLQE